MHPEDSVVTGALPELPAGAADETTALPALTEAGDRPARRMDRYATSRRARLSSSNRRRAAVLSATAPLLIMSAVAAMAATATGPFAGNGSNVVVTAALGTDRSPVGGDSVGEIPSPSEKPTPSETATAEVGPPPPPPVPAPYTVVPGDTLASVEQHCGVPWRRLFDANPEIADPSVLQAGMTVRCPAPDEQIAERPLPEPTPEPEPEPEPDEPSGPAPPPAPAVPDGSVWDRLAQCESGGNWQINTGNGYYGGLQFSASSWRAVGGTGLPHEHSREEQIHRGELLQARQGWGAWPACARRLGLL